MNKSIILIVILAILAAVLFGIIVLLGSLLESPTSQSDTAVTQEQEKTNKNNTADNSGTFSAKNISKVTDQDITSFLSTNPDAKNYMEKNKDFKIEQKTILTKDDITAGQTAENFKEVYQGLDLENNRYLKVNLMNAAGDNGLVAVLDFKVNKVIKAYGLILLKAGVSQ